jgi:hypothetical protein
MDAAVKFLTAIAALLAAVAWPAALLFVVFIFRSELRLVLSRFPLLFDRVTKASFSGLAVELEHVADIEVKSDTDRAGKVTSQQFEAAARIAVQSSPRELLAELDRLCLEYDSLRRILPSGDTRTRAMTRIIIKMRSLAPSLVDSLDAYKGSGSAGSRLAAIAMMQMVPKVADIGWLKGRFSSEQPFLFYHAALALQNMGENCHTLEGKQRLREVARQALATVKNFSGTPDQSTIEVLEMLISSLSDQ